MSASSSGSHSPTATPQVKPEFDMPLSGSNSKYQLTPDNKDEDLKEETADKDSRKREVRLRHFTLAGEYLLTLHSTID